MKQPNNGHGLLIEAPSLTDYVSGDGRLSGEVINPEGDWLPYVPLFEHQAPQFETNSCASHGTLNALEGLHKLLYGTELNLSDRMLAKGSDTDPGRGNTPQKVAEWFRKNWSALDEDWPMAGVKTAQEYYKAFPDLLYSKATIVKQDNKFGYEAITNPSKLKLQEALTKGTVCMSVALMPDENGVYYRPNGWSDNHWVWLLKVKQNDNYLIFDSYEPSIKEIRADFLPQVAYRYTLNEEAIDFITQAIAWITNWIENFKYAPPSIPKPVTPLPPKQAPSNNILNAFALAIQKHEGWYPTSRSYRNHNPGNCRYSSVGYLPKYGTVKEDRTGVNVKQGQRGFAIFSSYEIGFLYLKNLILEKARKHPEWNLFDFFGDEKEGWAPKSDGNNYLLYAETVAKQMSVNPATWRLSHLL